MNPKAFSLRHLKAPMLKDPAFVGYADMPPDAVPRVNLNAAHQPYADMVMFP